MDATQSSNAPQEIASDLAYLRTGISNVYFAGRRERWVLIDAGVAGNTDRIRRAVSARFGVDSKPAAIILTHGHFDHAGCALELAKAWGVPVYAHPLEFPYLTGKSAYPRKDPTVGGAMAFLSRFFPTHTADISEVLQDLPSIGAVPGLDGWMWILTPGHSPGHVSFLRESDSVLVAGDALATANLDSWYGLVSYRRQISRPPSPFTYDWDEARASVRALANLKPNVLACGHGEPMFGSNVASELDKFSRGFRPPAHGRYVPEPAEVNEHGVAYEPPAPPDNLPKIAAGIVTAVFLFAGVVYSRRSSRGPASSPSRSRIEPL